jgi:TolB-like protein
MEFRMGVHLGDVTVEGERLYGDGVNIAARLERLAEPGGICVSDDVIHQVQRKLELDFDDLGEQTVKNIPDPVHAYLLRERAAAAPARPARRALVRWAVAAAIIIAAGVLALVAQRVWPPPQEPGVIAEAIPETPPLTSIAVLPFDDLSPDGNQEWLANGMAEDLIESLSRIRELRVIARTSSEVAKASGADLRTIGEQLQVGAVVEGSVRRSGDQLRVTAQFIRVADDSHLWSGRYDRKLDDVFAIQREIARDVAEAIRTELGIRGSLGGPYLERARYEPRDVRAWELVRKGWDLHTKGQASGQRELMVQALDLFRDAARIDPDYAYAHSGIMWTHYELWNQWGRLEEHKQLALEAANRLREISVGGQRLEVGGQQVLVGPQQFEARLSWHQWDFEAAEEGLAPLAKAHGHGDWGLHVFYAQVLFATGRIDEACVHWRKAAELNPIYMILQVILAVCDRVRGNYNAAIEKLEQILTLAPDAPLAAVQLGLNYHLNGMDAEALEAYVRIPEVDAEFEAALRRAFHEGGWAGLNGALVAGLAARSGDSCGPDPAIGAHLYARAGQSDEMYRCLDRAIERGPAGLWLTWHESWDPYRGDARFQAILRRVGLAD